MTCDELFEKLLSAYSIYYNVKRDDCEAPFDAEAVFNGKQEQYFLMKSAKLSEMTANEYVFIAKRDRIDKDELLNLDDIAWNRGIKRVEPDPSHKSTDVTLIVIVNELDDDIAGLVKKLKHSVSYKLGLWGFGRYKAAVIETYAGRLVTNRLGTDLKRLVMEIYK
ncbi:MAG: hypothetical protein K6G22_14210 [Lachnospiraceae bacterium]|nr:hypothetical protein [Lachnospiraceae bacterium]